MVKFIPSEKICTDADGREVYLIHSREDYFDVMKLCKNGFCSCKQTYVDGKMRSGFIKTDTIILYYLSEETKNEKE